MVAFRAALDKKPRFLDTITMDNNNPVPEPPLAPVGGEGQAGKKKLFLILGIVIVVILVIAVAVFIMNRAGQNQNGSNTGGGGSLSGGGQNGGQEPGTTIMPTIAFQGESPDIVAKNFYEWYVNDPAPISSGAYESRPDITPEFKVIMGRFHKRGIDPGYDHVFCEDIVLPKNAVVKETVVDESLTQGLTTFTAPEGNELFRINTDYIGGKWYVSDVKCALTE